jgi:hypothetical protein
MENKLYDILVLGYGKSGQAAVKKLLGKGLSLAIADGSLLCEHKRKLPMPCGGKSDTISKIGTSVAGADLYKLDASLMQYKRGLFITYMGNGDAICSKSMLVATGTLPKRDPWIRDGISTGEGVCAVIGGAGEAIDLAKLASKAFAKVILIDKSMPELTTAIKRIKNIETLPYCSVLSEKKMEEGKMRLTLSTGVDVEADAIAYEDILIPQTAFLPTGFMKKDAEGKIEESLIPGLTAAGSCTTWGKSGETAAAELLAFLEKSAK